ASLRAGTTTCAAKADTAGYWVPTLYYDGVAVTTPYAAQIYYMVAGRNPATIRPFPAGLEMVAGTATATGPIPKNGANWGCGGGSPIPFSLTAPAGRAAPDRYPCARCGRLAQLARAPPLQGGSRG